MPVHGSPGATHVLVAVPNAADRRRIAAAAEGLGYLVCSAGDADEMRRILDIERPVDLIVLDAALPHDPRFPLTLEAEDRGIRLVLISGEPDVIERSRRSGNQMLRTPFTADELAVAMARAFASDQVGQRSEHDETIG
jgi:CheY-like chemotaxis protein